MYNIVPQYRAFNIGIDVAYAVYIVMTQPLGYTFLPCLETVFLTFR